MGPSLSAGLGDGAEIGSSVPGDDLRASPPWKTFTAATQALFLPFSSQQVASMLLFSS